jgi:hypothetical protein
MKINFSKLTYLFFFLIILSNCTKVDPTTGEKVLIETDAKKKAEAEARKGGGIFGDIGKRNSNTNFEFATSNILWRATLKSLEFLPLLNADYSGGIIIYDWYSQPNNSKEQIKISIQFLNNELRSDSVKVIAHKKVCDNADKCSNSILDQNFANSIKESIIVTARTLKIEESKKEKK